MRKQQKQFIILTNPINLPFTCFSYFISTGMKDDVVRGISHLSEHVVIEELKRSHPELFQQNLINAYVDKEFTCFNSTSFCNNVLDVLFFFGNMFESLKTALTSDIIENQKDIIYNIENERVLSNPQLLNILAIEQLAFDSSLRIPTIVDESFNSLGKTHVIDYIKNKYFSATHYLILSGRIPMKKIINAHFIPVISALTDSSSFSEDNIASNISIPIDKLENANDARLTVAISLKRLRSPCEYFALNILCLLYKVCINNSLKETDFYLKDISFKLYSEKTLLTLTYNRYYTKSVKMLSDIDIMNCAELFNNLKKHFLFGYLHKSCDLLSFNKEIFKVRRYLNEDMSFSNMKDMIEKVSFKDLIFVHKAVIDGDYIYLPEDYYEQLD